jgi:hydrogenase nickel incorporation protein HypB
MEIKVLENILKVNDQFALEIREELIKHNILTINMIGSAGSGKTTLLEQTIKQIKNKIKLAVIEGDIETTRDAERIKNLGVDVIQINTKGACHLDAHLVHKAMKNFNLNEIQLIVIENVGNLVCPASFDLGEDFKVCVLSVPEGDDKPEKYPKIFRESKCVVLNKIDLFKYTTFNKENFYRDMKHINGKAFIFELSALKGDGVDEWCNWLLKQTKGKSGEQK